MSHLFEDYLEVGDSEATVEHMIELVHEEPRRVFLTRNGEVQAVLLRASDYNELFLLELDADDSTEFVSQEEMDAFTREIEKRRAQQ
ncbi:MAG TPA: hypothetical protein VF618_15085 [Thermoanaerobaculia bacterium]